MSNEIFLISSAECKLPMGLENGIIQDSQISASGHLCKLNFTAPLDVVSYALSLDNLILVSSTGLKCADFGWIF